MNKKTLILPQYGKFLTKYALAFIYACFYFTTKNEKVKEQIVDAYTSK